MVSGVGGVFSVMALVDRRAQRLQPLGHRRRAQIGTGNLVAQRQQHLGDAAHADAADAHEMYALNLGKHEKP